MTELHNIICGVYQLKLSSSYMQKYLEGNSEIFVHQEDNQLMRVRLQSRHTSSRTYLLWIEYSPAEVTAWYCTCRAGAQVAELCSRITLILWYLVNDACSYEPLVLFLFNLHVEFIELIIFLSEVFNVSLLVPKMWGSLKGHSFKIFNFYIKCG